MAKRAAILGTVIRIVLIHILARTFFHRCGEISLTFGTFRILSTSAADIKIKYVLIMKRYNAPPSIRGFPAAMEYPHVQSGGMSAVAMATPGMILLALSCLVCPTIPAMPPADATSTSKK